jgi:hypothetical protein
VAKQNKINSWATQKSNFFTFFDENVRNLFWRHHGATRKLSVPDGASGASGAVKDIRINQIAHHLSTALMS